MAEQSTPTPPAGDLFDEIDELKRARNAVILAHFYQDPDIQDLADVIGDSLALSQAAQKTDADVILFAGVNFMAETAKILNPDKTVVVPDLAAGCSLADSAPTEAFRRFREAHPDHVVVSYINTTAEVKALSDWICTSSNALRIIQQIPEEKPILFAPDANMGRWLIRETGRDLTLWQGVCVVHDVFSEKRILKLMEEHPDAEVLAHPECTEAILRHADVIGSTTKIIKHAVESAGTEFIVATEPGVLHQMEKLAPGKTYIAAPPENETCACNECPYMRLNTLEKIRDALRDLRPQVDVPKEIAGQALVPLERMLALG
jgi:quinolinate synthase